MNRHAFFIAVVIAVALAVAAVSGWLWRRQERVHRCDQSVRDYLDTCTVRASPIPSGKVAGFDLAQIAQASKRTLEQTTALLTQNCMFASMGRPVNEKGEYDLHVVTCDEATLVCATERAHPDGEAAFECREGTIVRYSALEDDRMPALRCGDCAWPK